MKIKNLYLKVLTKEIKPEGNRLNLLINQRKISISNKRVQDKLKENGVEHFENVKEEDKAKIDIPALCIFTNEDEEQIKIDVIADYTKYSHQLYKINKIPILDNFIRNNISKIDELSKKLLLSDTSYTKLLKDSNIAYGNNIDIHIDSNTVFCTIVSISKAELEEALNSKTITQERFDELIKQLEL